MALESDICLCTSPFSVSFEKMVAISKVGLSDEKVSTEPLFKARQRLNYVRCRVEGAKGLRSHKLGRT